MPAARWAWVGRDGSAYVLDVDAGGEVRAVAPEADFVDVDPTGTRLAVMSKLGDVTVYALPGLEATWTAKGDGAITIGDQIDALGAPPAPAQFASLEIHGSLAWTPDSQALVASRTFILRTLDAQTGAERATTIDSLRRPRSRLRPRATSPAREARRQPRGDQVVDRTPRADRRPAGSSTGRLASSARLPRRCSRMVGSRCSTAPASSASCRSSPSRREAIDPHVGQGAALSVSPTGTVLAVAGQSGVALISLDGSGLIRTAVPRTSDHLTLAGGPNASWVTSDSPPYPEPPEELPSLRSAGGSGSARRVRPALSRPISASIPPCRSAP